MGLLSGGGLSLGAGFLEEVAVHLLLAENYNRTTTDHTTEAQSAQRLHGGGFGANSSFAILANLG